MINLDSELFYLPFKIVIAISLIIVGYSSKAQHEQLVAHFSELQKQAKKTPVTLQYVQDEMGLVEDFASLQQIILLRHGEPALNKKGWRKRKEAIEYIKAYDSVGVYPPTYQPIILNENDVNVVFTSTLYRSISTAEQLFQRAEDQNPKALFREFERKIFAFPNIKLPLKSWLTTSRLFWLMGMNKKDIESFSEAKKRAKEGVVFLEEDAQKNGKTLLVSHGLLNNYLAKYLKKNGWVQVFDGGKGYMSQKMFVRSR